MKNLIGILLLAAIVLMAIEKFMMPMIVITIILIGFGLLFKGVDLATKPRGAGTQGWNPGADAQSVLAVKKIRRQRPAAKRIAPPKRRQAKLKLPPAKRKSTSPQPPISIGGAYRPLPALVRILSLAYPCRHFRGACKDMRWDPKAGHIPRGYCGATGTASEVKLVLVVAEPGDPQPGDPATMDEALQWTVWAFREGPGQFHRNARKLLEYCWPGLSFDQQLRKVWITESVLCSAAVTTGPVPREVEQACGRDFLAPQLAIFQKAIVLALGGKAHQRLQRLGIPHEQAHALAPPGCNQRAADPSWRRIGELVRQKG